LPAAAGGGQENPLARGQKISSPKTPPFFTRSPFGRIFFEMLYLDFMLKKEPR